MINITENKIFENIDFKHNTLEDEYYNCTFRTCNFSNLSIYESRFNTCTFKDCDFSMTKFKSTLRDVTFNGCKMLGSNFTEVNKFSGGILFEHTHLNYSIFSATRLRKTIFRHCDLNEVYFDDADLSNSIFEHCNLERASFIGCNLEKTDFSTSYNFNIDPNSCKLKNAIFSEHNLRGLVEHLNIIIK